MALAAQTLRAEPAALFASLAAGFMASWARALGLAYVVAVPGIYFLAPLARRIGM